MFLFSVEDVVCVAKVMFFCVISAAVQSDFPLGINEVLSCDLLTSCPVSMNVKKKCFHCFTFAMHFYIGTS